MTSVKKTVTPFLGINGSESPVAREIWRLFSFDTGDIHVMTNFPPIFVINLKDAIERRAIMESSLNALGLQYRFFDAIDGRNFSVRTHCAYAGLKRRIFFGKDLTGGELGCLLSHRSVLERIVSENIETALVLEDDVILNPDFIKVVQRIMQQKFPWKMVRFLGSEKIAHAQQRKILDLGDGYHLTRLCATPGGAYAYLLTKEAAQILLAHMLRNWCPNDTLMGQTWRTGLPVFTVQPGLAIPDLSLGSFIGEKRFDKSKQLTGWEARLYPLTRAYYKISEGFFKRLCYWGAAITDYTRRW